MIDKNLLRLLGGNKKILKNIFRLQFRIGLIMLYQKIASSLAPFRHFFHINLSISRYLDSPAA